MMQTAKRIFLLLLAVPIISVLLMTALIRFSGLPLGFIDQPLSLFLQQNLGGGMVNLERAALEWNSNTGFFQISAEQIGVDEPTGAGLRADNVAVVFSADAFWQQGQLALQAATIERLTLKQDRRKSLPQAADLILPSLDGTSGTGQLAYVSELAIRDIRVGEYETAASNGSHLLVLREGNRLTATIELAYMANGIESSVNALADIKNDGSGSADIELNNLDPRDIGRFSALLSPLRGIQLPVTALLGIDFAAGGRPKQGTIEVFVEPGSVRLSSAALSVDELIISATADFTSRKIALNDIRFNVGGIAGRMSGAVEYEQNRRGQISEIGLNVSGEGIQVDVPAVFAERLTIPRAEIVTFYDLSRDRIEIERFDVTHNFGMARTAGMVKVSDTNPYFDFTTNFGSMTRAGVEALWPVGIAPRTRKWVDANVRGGKLTAGSLTLNVSLEELVGRAPGTPLREDAMGLDLAFEDVGLQYLSFMPPVENSDMRMRLRGTSFEAEAKGGFVRLPSKDVKRNFSIVQIADATFETPNYRDRNQPVDIRFGGNGQIRDVIRAINVPPLNAVKNIDFDFDRLIGEAFVEAHLNMAIFAPPAQRKLVYKLSGRTKDLAVEGALGPYQLRKGRGFIDIDNQGLHAMGRAEINGFDGGFAWQQPFAPAKAGEAKLAVHGHFSPQAVADLGQSWAGVRLTGAPHINLLVNGPVQKPDNFRLFADLEAAELSMHPLAYQKPVGLPAHIHARIENNADGEVSDISADLTIDDKKITEVTLRLDGDLLSGFKMTPISLGRDRNLVAKLALDDDTRMVTVTADRFDVSRLFASGNREVKLKPEPFEMLPFLGAEAVVDVQLNQVVGQNNVEMDRTQMRVLRRNDLHEELKFQGVFADGSDMVMSIDRDNPVRRRFLIQTERAGNVFRMFDWASEMFGGNLVMNGTLFDTNFSTATGKKDIDGRFTMTGFRARNVPVLASMLSLASLSGIADTLSGDGIKFDKAQGNFWLADGRLTIDDARMNGAAVGLTMQGDYDIGRGDVDIGGTLIPAYTLNSFFGKIPLVGPVLGGRRGEGIIGIGYRVSGENGKANVLVNPLSVLTPGVFRRIFELGIGLGERGEELNPDLDEPDLTD